MTAHHLDPHSLNEDNNARTDVEILNSQIRTGGEHVSAPPELAKSQHGPGQYQIRVKEHLDDRWAVRFGNLSLSHRQGGTTLSGLLPDQAALHGVLRKIRDSGLTLTEVIQLASEEAEPVEVDLAQSRD